MAKSEESDYIQPIYKDRALKHLVKLAGGKKASNLLNPDQKRKMMLARAKIAHDMQFNQLKWFKPFKYQEEFFKTGLNSTRRGMIAANRAGKTIASTYETAYHLTGRYPENWKGKRWDKPIIAMAAGESWEQVAKTLQNKLLG
jgi:CRISPR/Cas system-associated endonuclease/helicase Cas3